MKKTFTTDRDEIREWVEERGGVPSAVRSADGASAGGSELRIDFGDFEEELDEMPWDLFFRIMSDNTLAFVYLVEGSGSGQSKLYKIVPVDQAEREEDNEEDDPDMHHGESGEEAEGDEYTDDGTEEEDDDDTTE